MMHNILTLILSAVPHNGYPKAKIKYNTDIVYDGLIDDSNHTIDIALPITPGKHSISLQRYGKTSNNSTNLKEQILKVIDIKIDDVFVPKYILINNSMFRYNHIVEPGALEFYPNGCWTFEFETPFVTWCLNQKIVHEAKYNADYEFPWSYKLGPGQAQKLSHDLDKIINRVKTLDE